MRRTGRREVLGQLALGSAGVILVSRSALGRETPKRVSPSDDLARTIRDAPAEKIYEVAVRAMDSGARPQDLLAAAFVAGIQDIRPNGPGGKFHAVLMVESTFQLLSVSTPEQGRLAALWALWDFKRCQERDRVEENDWSLPPRPDVSFSSVTSARRELLAALDGWDADRADRAVTGLLEFEGPEQIFEMLWPYAARCFADLGHKIIFCVHAERTLRRLDSQHAEPALRSLVRGMLFPGEAGKQTASFERAMALTSRLTDSWLSGEEAPERSVEMLRALRGRSAAESQEAIVAALGDGMGPNTVWDGLRLHGAELFYRRDSAAQRRHVPVHTITELNAFAHVWRSTGNRNTRRLCLLQTAGWLAEMRDAVPSQFGDQRGPGLDALAAGARKPPSYDKLFSQPSVNGTYQRLSAGATETGAYLDRVRSHLYERATQDHQYKFAAALHEEARAIHPMHSARLLAPAITYLPTARDERTDMYRKSMAALDTSTGIRGTEDRNRQRGDTCPNPSSQTSPPPLFDGPRAPDEGSSQQDLRRLDPALRQMVRPARGADHETRGGKSLLLLQPSRLGSACSLRSVPRRTRTR